MYVAGATGLSEIMKYGWPWLKSLVDESGS